MTSTTGSRAVYFVSAGLIGAGLALLVYRFAVLGLVWDGSTSWVFPGLAAGLAVGGAQMVKGRTDPPRPLPRVAAALAGAGVAAGLAFVVVPPLGHARLSARQLPGFTVDVPPGEVETELLDYETGRLSLKRVAGTHSVVAVQWETGAAAREDLELAARALAQATGGGGAYQLAQVPGPGGAPVDTVVIETDKGPMRITMVGCGMRRITVFAMGASGIDDVHRKMVASVACTPDAAQEAQRPGEIRLALTLPGWYAQERLVGQVTLTDGTSTLLLRSTTPSKAGSLEAMLPALFGAMGATITLGARAGDRVPFSGTLEGDAVDGWGRQHVCGTRAVTMIALAPDRARADELAARSASARCLHDGEAPPAWPDPPAGGE